MILPRSYSRRNPTVLIREVPTRPRSRRPARAPLPKSQSHRTDQGSSDCLAQDRGGMVLGRSRNPTVLIREVPTSIGGAAQIFVGNRRRNPTVLIREVPTAGVVGQLDGLLRVAIPPY